MEFKGAIQLQEISKSYSDKMALRDISFEVDHGSLFGLIGPDGAGKTTMLRILVSLLKPDSGSSSVLGWDTVRDYKEIRRQAGYMAGRFSLYADLSVEENIKFYAAVFGVRLKDNYDLIEEIYEQLAPFRKRRAGQLSGGMKQKLALCCALIHRPAILFLDEPTTGVDPVSRGEFWEMLLRLKAQKITLMVSTPYMDEANRCDQIALMHQGRLFRKGTPEAIISEYPRPLWSVQAVQISRILKDLREAEWCHSAFPFGQAVHLATTETIDAPGISRFLEHRKHEAVEVIPIKAGIEDCFMEFHAAQR